MKHKFFNVLLISALSSILLSACNSFEDSSTQADSTEIVDGLKIRYCFIDDNPYNRRHKLPAPFTDVKTVTIHNTAGVMSAKQERDRVNNRRDKKSVSFHFAVDENEAIQLIPLNIHAWHAGDGEKGEGNLYSLSIEICRSKCVGDQEKLYRKAEENAVILSAHLLNAYNLPIDALKKHQDWSGKYCPHKILSENRWNDFKKQVELQMKNAD